jgi:hypothetical protein
MRARSARPKRRPRPPPQTCRCCSRAAGLSAAAAAAAATAARRCRRLGASHAAQRCGCAEVRRGTRHNTPPAIWRQLARTC